MWALSTLKTHEPLSILLCKQIVIAVVMSKRYIKADSITSLSYLLNKLYFTECGRCTLYAYLIHLVRMAKCV